MILGSAGESIPVADGELCLGTWQRVLFIELDRARAPPLARARSSARSAAAHEPRPNWRSASSSRRSARRRSASASIWRTRSRVMPSMPPISSSDFGSSVAVEAVAKLQDLLLAVGQLGDRARRAPPRSAAPRPARPASPRRSRRDRRYGRVVVADRPVERRDRARRGAHLAHLLDRQLRLLRDLLVVGVRSSVANSSRSARSIFCSRSTMCTGIRIVRALLATPRCTACLIHQVAYVENLKPLRQSNFSAARIRPMIPSWIRSSSDSPWPW